MSSWSYGSVDPVDTPELEEKPTPPEVVEKLNRHQNDGDRYWAAITGDYRPYFDDPIKGTAYLVRGIKKAAHETGARPPAVMETLSYIAEKWPTGGKHNLPRWWTREDKDFSDAHVYVFSSATDPEEFFEDPRPEWYRQEQTAEVERHEAQIRSAFWKCLQDAKGGMVFAHHGDVAAHPEVEVDGERTRQLLHDWSAVKQIDDPRGDSPAGLNDKKAFAVKDQ